MGLVVPRDDRLPPAGGPAPRAWVVLELRISTPMIDLRLFRRRAFSAPVLSAMLCYANISATFLLPFALIQGRG